MATKYVDMVPDLVIDGRLQMKCSAELMSANIQKLENE